MKVLLSLMAAFATSSSMANVVLNSAHINQSGTISRFNDMSMNHFSSLNKQSQNSYAKQWGMSATQFKKYLFVKANTPTGALYANAKLDPNMLLGINEMDQGHVQQAQKYIRQAVINEHHRIETLIKAQNMYQKTSQRLFPSETPIALAGSKPSSYVSYGNAFGAMLNPNAVLADAKYALIIKANSPDQGMKGLLQKAMNKILIKAGTRIDIYDVSGASDEKIRGWAKEMGISRDLIFSQRITLNHAGKFVSKIQSRLGRSFANYTFLRDVKGHYRVLSLSEVAK